MIIQGIVINPIAMPIMDIIKTLKRLLHSDKSIKLKAKKMINKPQIKVTFVRELNILEASPEAVADGYKRTLEVIDNEGNAIYFSFRGAEKKHLMFKGLKSQ